MLVDLAGVREAWKRQAQLVRVVGGPLGLIEVLGIGELGSYRGLHLLNLQAALGGAVPAAHLGLGHAFAAGPLVPGETALLVLVATAAGAGIVASGLGHAGHHEGGEDAHCTGGSWRIPRSTICCWPATAISPRRRAPDAAIAAARCIRPPFRASLAAGPGA
jgi:hypothetical protein